MVSNEYTYDKRHVLIFRTQSGEMIVGTNDLIDVSNQDWFREFLAIGRAPRRDMRDPQETFYQERPQAPPMVAPRPVQQPQPPRQTVAQQMGQYQQPRPSMPSSFLDLTPQEMTMPMWESLNAQQQAQWMSRYNIQG